MVSLLDRLARLSLAVPNRSTVVFPDGWGDRLTLELFDDMTRRPLPEAADTVWERKAEHRGFRRRRAVFRSPLADLLPDTARVVPVELTEPARGSERVVVVLPAWNEEGLERRRSLAELLVPMGIAVAAFDIPLYGRRRAGASSGMPIRTVSDFALMGVGAVDEAAALLARLGDDYRQVGVAGFSMGGALAGLVSARATVPLATGLMAASHSPAPVYLDGAISRAVAWGTLGGHGSRDELRRLLDAVSVTGFEPRRHHAAAVVVAGRRDGFVPPASVETLVGHWKGSEVRWVDTGHAGLRFRHQSDLADAIGASFERLDQRGAKT